MKPTDNPMHPLESAYAPFKPVRRTSSFDVVCLPQVRHGTLNSLGSAASSQVTTFAGAISIASCWENTVPLSTQVIEPLTGFIPATLIIQ